MPGGGQTIVGTERVSHGRREWVSGDESRTLAPEDQGDADRVRAVLVAQNVFGWWAEPIQQTMYRRILLPTDGSRGMASAIAQCFGLARFHDAVVHVLYVVDVRSIALLPDETQSRVRSLLAEEGDAAVAAIRSLAESEGIELVPAIVDGIPHDAILAYADEHEIDLIVMGTHGRTGEDSRMVGSVAEEVVRKSEVPVLVTRMREEDLAAIEEAIPEEQRRYIA